MDVFVLDIGCTNLKGLVFRREQVMEHWVTPTPEKASELLDACLSMYANPTGIFQRVCYDRRGGFQRIIPYVYYLNIKIFLCQEKLCLFAKDTMRK